MKLRIPLGLAGALVVAAAAAACGGAPSSQPTVPNSVIQKAQQDEIAAMQPTCAAQGKTAYLSTDAQGTPHIGCR